MDEVHEIVREDHDGKRVCIRTLDVDGVLATYAHDEYLLTEAHIYPADSKRQSWHIKIKVSGLEVNAHPMGEREALADFLRQAEGYLNDWEAKRIGESVRDIRREKYLFAFTQ